MMQRECKIDPKTSKVLPNPECKEYSLKKNLTERSHYKCARMFSSYERMFGQAPKQVVTSPIKKGDHPELDTSDLLEPDDVQKYRSLIGALQWAITIGRFDIATGKYSHEMSL